METLEPKGKFYLSVSCDLSILHLILANLRYLVLVSLYRCMVD
jgi:hypothetical protein